MQPEHLVLGLLSEPDALAAQAMKRRVPLADIRKVVTAELPPDGSAGEGLVPYSDESKKVLELTFREALRLGHNYIGTEHVLLALLDAEPDDGVLALLGLVTPEVEDDLLSLLTKEPECRREPDPNPRRPFAGRATASGLGSAPTACAVRLRADGREDQR